MNKNYELYASDSDAAYEFVQECKDNPDKLAEIDHDITVSGFVLMYKMKALSSHYKHKLSFKSEKTIYN